MEQRQLQSGGSGRSSRVQRTEQEICVLLDEYEGSSFSVKEFCELYDLVEATFYSWLKKYRPRNEDEGKQKGFASLEVIPTLIDSKPALFAEVNGIKIYREVPPAYLKALSA